MKHLLISTIALFIVPLHNVYSQTYQLTDFKQVSIPPTHSEEISEWNRSPYPYFIVSFVKDILRIEKQGNFPYIHNYETSKGTLIGVNNGEFGGGLYYRPKDTTIKQLVVNGDLKNPKEEAFGEFLLRRKFSSDAPSTGRIPIKYGNIAQIFTFNNKTYIMESLAHGGTSIGSFTQIGIHGNNVDYKEVLKLNDAPMAFAIHKNVIYLATLERFYVIKDWVPKQIADNLFWGYLYPQSVAVKDPKHIYVGMKAGYATIDAKNGKINFFKYQK